MTGEAPAVAGAAVVAAAAAAAGDDKTEFAKRNPHLEKFIPDAIENFVDKLIPDALEAKMDRGAKVVARKYSKIATDFNEGFGEIAGVLFKVAKYAASRFNIGDIVFGVYHLADHHNKMAVVDAVDGAPVTDAALVKHLVYCTDLAVMSYCPTKEQLCEAATIPAEDVVTFQPKADTNRPAYCIAVDNANKNVIWGFRGTTDLSDMLTDACASCTPYLDGYAHWGMLEATKWFAENELKNVRALLDEHPGYRLLLVGHSLGAGVATLLAHWIKNNEDAAALMKGIDFEAVGVATPAVLTAEMAEGCSGYVSSVVQMHDVVPRFSIHNVFAMKEEMDATKWGDTLAEKLKDWMVPDVIERSETYQRLARHVSKSADAGVRTPPALPPLLPVPSPAAPCAARADRLARAWP
ncbi:MAG: Alpha/Beta hydrolase protein [Monoraphidium minutum]|nr:MAG: Alpha/Beta hydrolase protein [Monoraphidium minutum]